MHSFSNDCRLSSYDRDRGKNKKINYDVAEMAGIRASKIFDAEKINSDEPKSSFFYIDPKNSPQLCCTGKKLLFTPVRRGTRMVDRGSPVRLLKSPDPVFRKKGIKRERLRINIGRYYIH